MGTRDLGSVDDRYTTTQIRVFISKQHQQYLLYKRDTRRGDIKSTHGLKWEINFYLPSTQVHFSNPYIQHGQADLSRYNQVHTARNETIKRDNEQDLQTPFLLNLNGTPKPQIIMIISRGIITGDCNHTIHSTANTIVCAVCKFHI